MTNSVQTVFLVAVPVLVIGFAVSWLLQEIPLRDTVHVDAAWRARREPGCLTRPGGAPRSGSLSTPGGPGT